MKVRACVMALSCYFLSGAAVHAAPILGGGWAGDVISAAATDSADSPYVYALGAPALFSITDCCVVGDEFKVYDFGGLILTTWLSGPQPIIPPPGAAGGNTYWTDGDYQHGQVVLPAGAHSLTVQGDGAGGLPAGFYARIDSCRAGDGPGADCSHVDPGPGSVPEPATAALLLVGGSLVGLVRRRQVR